MGSYVLYIMESSNPRGGFGWALFLGVLMIRGYEYNNFLVDNIRAAVLLKFMNMNSNTDTPSISMDMSDV